MAELLLKIGTVGPDPAYQDGDIVVAQNDRRISQVHLEHHCHVNNFGFTNDGRRPADTLAQKFREATHQYKFERISSDTVLRTDLLTLKSDELGEKDNENGEHIYVAQFIARQLNSPHHGIFGEPGKEVWYGGTVDYSKKILDDFWPLVEEELKIRKDDYSFWPFSDHELKHFLALKTDDFDDVKATDYTASIYQAPVVQGDPPGPMLKKRAHLTAWKTLDLGVSIAAVESGTVKVDIRDTKSFISADIVTAKTLSSGEVKR